jgi:DNA-binding MarR family transcriptional regulator
MTSLSSMGLCPINFKLFDKLKSETKNIESALLLSKINFHSTKTKILKDGKKCIARSREQLAEWFGFSKTKTDSLIKSLEEQGFIEKKIGLWYGQKRVFIHSTQESQSPINIELLNFIIELTGSLKASLVFSKIAFKHAHTKISHEHLSWCCITREDLSLWSGFSLRKIDSILNALERKGLILKKTFSYHGRSKLHFHIPSHVITLVNKKSKKISEPPEVIHTEICRSRPAKNQLSIRIRTNTKKTNNNTEPKIGQGVQTNIEPVAKPTCDIILNTHNKNLSQQQANFIKAALSRTIQRFNLTITSPKECLEEVIFSITQSQQHKAIESFKHRVSRCMKIIASGHWCTPFGFSKYSELGCAIKAKHESRAGQWQKEKEIEKEASHGITQALFEESPFKPKDSELTKEALNLCEQLASLNVRYKDSVEPFVKKYADSIIEKIQALVCRGADVESIQKGLNKN